MLTSPGMLVFYITVALYTYETELTIQYYPNSNPNHKNGTKPGPRNPNPTMFYNFLPLRRFAGTIVVLGFLDTDLYLNQYSDHTGSCQHGVGPYNRCHTKKIASRYSKDFLKIRT